MEQIIAKFNDGGPFFMFPILVLLLLVIALIVKGFLSGSKKKTISLLSSIGLFTLVWGLLGQTIGFVKAFDAIQIAGELKLSVAAEGLKMSLLTTIFGLFVFLISRLGIIVFIWMQKEEN